MNGSRKNRFDYRSTGTFPFRATAFVFCDKETGAPCFQVRAAVDGSMPMDEAACLLALQCISRQQVPTDFRMMISTGEVLVTGLAARAAKLMRTCAPLLHAGNLSRRQEEVLDGIANGFSNKEIASNLNISVSTAKFHVSALLVKFEVDSRGALMHKVANLVSFKSKHSGQMPSEPAALAAGIRAHAGKMHRPLIGGPPCV
jgi:DNA-binding CsgD family transcriptional regulator